MSLNIAHRGVTDGFLENSMEAFRAAVSKGYDGFECDVRMSSDEVPVVIHDATLSRITDGANNGYVHDTAAQELAKYNIATLEEVLSLASDRCHIFLEIKHDDFVADNLPIKVLSVLKKSKVAKDVTVISFEKYF